MKVEQAIDLLTTDHAKLGRHVGTELRIVVIDKKGKETRYDAASVLVNYETHSIEITTKPKP